VARPEKEAVVAELTDAFQNAASTIFVQYQGLNVAEVSDLRSKLRSEGVTFVVRKNTLAIRAAEAANVTDAEPYFVGPTAFASHAEDPTVAARIIKDFAKDHEAISFKGGILDGKVLDEAAVKRLANVPTSDVLLGQLAGTLQGIITGLARALNALPSGLAIALGAVRDQKESAGA